MMPGGASFLIVAEMTACTEKTIFQFRFTLNVKGNFNSFPFDWKTRKEKSEGKLSPRSYPITQCERKLKYSFLSVGIEYKGYIYVYIKYKGS